MNECLRIRRLFLGALIYLFLSSLSINSLFAQSAGKVISGIVTDDNNTPLPGVSISVKGTNTGTVTDVAGKYTISMPDNASILVFSYIGFEAKEIQVGNRNTVNTNLAPQANALNEVVVVGYGTQKKVNLTGSVASVNFKDLENTPQANTLNILSGRVPGVSIVQPGGQPGQQTPEVFVRGIGTLNDASPLVVIDGVQATLTDLGNITPQEIAEISVLKDASSAAIYGARGANGVILVTTKSPGQSKMRVNFNSYYGLQQATYLSRFVESWQWLALHAEASGINDPLQTRAIEQLKQGIRTDSANNTQWYDEIFRTAPISNYNLSVSGGTQDVSFQGSLGYQQQEGIMINTSGKRYNFRTNVKAKISSKLEAGLNLWGYQNDFQEPFAGTRGIMDRANKATPVAPVRYSNGDWGVYNPIVTGGGAQRVTNPVLFSKIGYSKDTDLKATMQTYMQLVPIKRLKLRTALNYTYGNSFRDRFNPTYGYPSLDGTTIALSNLSNQVISNSDNSRQLQWQSTAVYDWKLAQSHQFTFLGGHEYTAFNSWVMNAQGRNMPSNDAPVLNQVIDNISVGGSKNEWRLQSFFGRVNYAFKDRYLLEGNMRIDGSSRFPSDNKYGYFPSFSAGWIISEEEVFKSLINNENVVNLVKIRGGIGKVGNDRIGNYAYNQVFNLGSYYNFGNSVTAGGAINQFSNPNIKWESTTTRNLGVDLGFLRNRINITYDVYIRYTDGILYRLPLPLSFGVTNPSQMPAILNVGEVSNKGWDLQVNHRNTIGKFNYNTGFNLSYVRNKVERLDTREALTNNLFLLREGEAINSYYGYIHEGLYRSQEDLDNYPAFSTRGLGLGSMRFKDVNKDGKITPDDRVVLGSANTPSIFGLNGGIAYQGVDMNFLFQGVKGKTIYIYDSNNRPGNAAQANFWAEWWENRYDEVNNPDGTWPNLRRSAPETEVASTFWLRDASYVRLKNIELGYTLPASVLNRIKVKNIRFYLAGQNLVTFSKLIKQLDPERSTGTADNRDYPQTKVYSIGINTSF